MVLVLHSESSSNLNVSSSSMNTNRTKRQEIAREIGNTNKWTEHNKPMCCFCLCHQSMGHSWNNLSVYCQFISHFGSPCSHSSAPRARVTRLYRPESPTSAHLTFSGDFSFADFWCPTEFLVDKILTTKKKNKL